MTASAGAGPAHDTARLDSLLDPLQKLLDELTALRDSRQVQRHDRPRRSPRARASITRPIRPGAQSFTRPNDAHYPRMDDRSAADFMLDDVESWAVAVIQQAERLAEHMGSDSFLKFDQAGLRLDADAHFFVLAGHHMAQAVARCADDLDIDPLPPTMVDVLKYFRHALEHWDDHKIARRQQRPPTQSAKHFVEHGGTNPWSIRMGSGGMVLGGRLAVGEVADVAEALLSQVNVAQRRLRT